MDLYRVWFTDGTPYPNSERGFFTGTEKVCSSARGHRYCYIMLCSSHTNSVTESAFTCCDAVVGDPKLYVHSCAKIVPVMTAITLEAVASAAAAAALVAPAAS